MQEECLMIKKDGEAEILNGKMLLAKRRELLLKLKKFDHLCWTCKNGYASKCTKVFLPKASIDKYGFITDGCQVYLKDMNNMVSLDKFIVTGCKNYVPTEEKYAPKNRMKM